MGELVVSLDGLPPELIEEIKKHLIPQKVNWNLVKEFSDVCNLAYGYEIGREILDDSYCTMSPSRVKDIVNQQKKNDAVNNTLKNYFEVVNRCFAWSVYEASIKKRSNKKNM